MRALRIVCGFGETNNAVFPAIFFLRNLTGTTINIFYRIFYLDCQFHFNLRIIFTIITTNIKGIIIRSAIIIISLIPNILQIPLL